MEIETLVNQALDQIGYTRHIGNIQDGSPAARIALNLWGQTRDELLYSLEPDWARKDAALVVFKQAPNIVGGTANYDVTPWDSTYPPLPWLYEYTMPSDIIKPLQIKTTPMFLPVWRPRPNTYRYLVDFSLTSVETILCNTPGAILTYIYKVLDPDNWDADFRTAIVQVIARKMAAPLGKQAPKEADDGNAAG